MTKKLLLASLLVISVIPATIAAKKNDLSAPAGIRPIDRGIYLNNTQIKKIYQAMEPHIQKARESYPAAKAKWQQELPEGHNFFVVTRIRDQHGSEEQVFISVHKIKHGIIKGFIYNKLNNVSGYEFKQPYSFPETDLIDWVITKPNGEQEGNFVGKFLSGLK